MANCPSLTVKNPRIFWIDIFKFMAMIMVFFHHTKASGYFAPLMFSSAIAAFFMASGFFADSHIEKSFFPFCLMKFRRLMIPYFFFLLLYFFPMSLDASAPHPALWKCALQALCGIRDKLFVAALWFLPALFSLSVIHWALSRVSRSFGRARLPFLFAVAGVMFVAAVLIEPHLKYGLPLSFNWSVRFYFFYLAGYALFPFLRGFSFSSFGILRKTFFSALVFFSFVVLLLAISNDPLFLKVREFAVLRAGRDFAHAFLDLFFLTALISAAKMMDGDNILARIGRDSLFLCGTEQLSTLTLLTCYSLLAGRPIKFSTPLEAFIFASASLSFAYFAVIPLVKSVFPTICEPGKKVCAENDPEHVRMR